MVKKSEEAPGTHKGNPALKTIEAALKFGNETPNAVCAMRLDQFIQLFNNKAESLGLLETYSEPDLSVVQGHMRDALEEIYETIIAIKHSHKITKAEKAKLHLTRKPEAPAVVAETRHAGRENKVEPESENTEYLHDPVFIKVLDTLVDALGADEDEITPESTLIGDLGAESIDFLDIVFRLEKNFYIKIPRGELFPENLSLANEPMIKDGMVTAEGIEELRKQLPHADVDSFLKDPRVQNISELFTVQMVMNYLKSKGV